MLILRGRAAQPMWIGRTQVRLRLTTVEHPLAQFSLGCRSLRSNVGAEHLAVEVALNLIPLTFVLRGGDLGL